jgi:hypothetical protein
VFLALLTVAVQIAMNLYAASVVTSAAYDAARLVATGMNDPPTAEAHARDLLGDVGDDAVFEWGADADAVRLRVVVEPPHVLLPVVDGPLGLDVIDRTVTVRFERPRPDG